MNLATILFHEMEIKNGGFKYLDSLSSRSNKRALRVARICWSPSRVSSHEGRVNPEVTSSSQGNIEKQTSI